MTHQLVQPEPETAFLVGIEIRNNHPLFSIEDSLNELSLLAKTAGLKVVGQTYQLARKADPATLIGSGKVQEVLEIIHELGAKIVIFDDELSPRHQRELSKIFGDEVMVLDRSALILDIFARHAATREGALQVELAQYEYRLPRLTRQWTHLARQAGGGSARGGAAGVGLRGPGETQLEVDRREIRKRIAKLKEEIEKVRRHRNQYRRQRRKSGVPIVALIGYTNAGKSTLLNALTNANVYIADQLFATLDPTTRRVDLPGGRGVLFTDTVGFIQKLPTTLIAAFRATLEEIAEANVLVHVVDASQSNALAQIETVEDTLAELDIPDIPRVLMWNKIDILREDNLPLPSAESLSSCYAAELHISAHTGTGIDQLFCAIEDILNASLIRLNLLIPYERGEIVSRLHEMVTIDHQEHTPDGVFLTAQMSEYLYENYSEFVVVSEA